MKKGVSTAIVIILVLLIFVSLILISFQWLLTYSPQTQWELEKSLAKKEGCLKIENIDTNNKRITVRNCGSIQLSNFIVYIDSEPFLYYSEKLGSGEIIQISYTEDIASGDHDIQVFSDYAESPKIIFNKKCIFPAFGDWDIYDILICYNQLIIINGNIRIYNGGSLTFYNVTLKMNTTSDLEYGIQVQNGGKMFIYDNDNKIDTINDASNITTGPYDATTHFFFQVRDGSQFEMKNSYIRKCGYSGAGVDFAGLAIYADNSVVVNNIFDNSYRAIQLRNTKNCLVSKNTVRNSAEYGILIVNYDDENQNNIVSDNILINNFHNIHTCNGAKNNTITRNNITGGTCGIYLHADAGGPASYNKYTYNNIRSVQYGIHISQGSHNNLFANSSVANSGIYDYNLTDATSTNNFMNMNFTDLRTIHFWDSTSWFNYNNRTDIELWLKTNVSAQTKINRELISWTQDLMQWNDSASSAITARYNITGLIPNTQYAVYNNTNPISGSPFNSGSAGEISFTINLPASEDHEIKVESV